MELIFSWMELIFLFLNSFVGIWTEVWLINSFGNHVIQISSRQMHFQDITNLWKVKVFCGNIYSLKSNTYFWGTVLFVQDGFLYLIMTRHKLTVHHKRVLPPAPQLPKNLRNSNNANNFASDIGKQLLFASLSCFMPLTGWGFHRFVWKSQRELLKARPIEWYHCQPPSFLIGQYL